MGLTELKSRCQQGWQLLEGLGENPLPLFQPPALLGLWPLPLTSAVEHLQISNSASDSYLPASFSSLIRTLVIALVPLRKPRVICLLQEL